jgi:acetolactate synthase-1/2/3 large subunit
VRHGNIGFIDALHARAGEIKTVSVHHESVAGFMADVYYRVSGQPTATFTSCGPGSANLPISLANAFFDSVPFYAVTGNVPTSQFNRGAFQETYRHYQADFPSTVRAYCKRVFQPTTAAQLPVFVRQAWKTMVTGRPGTGGARCAVRYVQRARSRKRRLAPKDWNANISCRCGADPEGVTRGRRHADGAQRPVITRRAGRALRPRDRRAARACRKLRIPVAMSASGTGAIDAAHPLALGLVARNGPYQAKHFGAAGRRAPRAGRAVRRRTSSSWIPGFSFTIPPTR